MNNERVTQPSKDQAALVAEFSTTYGIDPEQIIFFTNEAKPFFDHEANAIISRRIGDVLGIESEPIASVYENSVSVQCKLTFKDGRFASAVGIANLDESINGEAMSPEQVLRLAKSRAFRNALVDAGVDLVKLHYVATGKVAELAGRQPKTLRNRLLAEAHMLGKQTGYIVISQYQGDLGPVPFPDKTGWKRMLLSRYGVESSGVMSDELLADLVAFLKTQIVPEQQPQELEQRIAA